MMERRIDIRDARKDELGAVNELAVSEKLEAMSSTEGICVAVDEGGRIVGFIRLIMGNNGFTHVNPVATDSSIRGCGIGRALIEYAFSHSGELYLVSRGRSKGFYQRLGFEDITWGDVDISAGHDCNGCPIIEECAPQPMRLVHHPY